MSIDNLITNPARLPLVGASILAADFADMGAECRAALDGGADLLHLDVMDGHFVPNLTMGPDMCRSLRRVLPDAFLEVHLMVARPGDFITPFADAGADHVTFHVESEGRPAEVAEAIHAAGMTAGVAINPPTDVSAVMPVIHSFDLILVMSVNPGFAGQRFMDSVLTKVRALVPNLNADQRVEIDGGLTPETAAAAREAGCDVLVAASAVFGAADYARAVADLRGDARVVTRRS